MQPQDPHPHITSFYAIWAAIGPLGGILVGHFLTRSWQRTQWLLDNRKQEYRELLSSLSDAYLHIVKYGTDPHGQDENQQSVERVRIVAFRTLHDRILIAEEIKKAEIMGKWLVTLSLYDERGRQAESNAMFSALTAELAKMALNGRGSMS